MAASSLMMQLMTTTARLMPRRNAKRTISEIRRNALKSGYRSGLEVTLAQQIEEAGLPVEYETEKINFVWPALGDVHA